MNTLPKPARYQKTEEYIVALTLIAAIVTLVDP